jgi:hypothetical protein
VAFRKKIYRTLEELQTDLDVRWRARCLSDEVLSYTN